VARLLKEHGEKPIFVTRGYRSLQEKSGANALCVDVKRHTSAAIGDEAMLLAAFAPTWVCRDRVEAIRQAEAYGTFVIMDDGFQNPSITPTTSLLVIDGEAGLGNERILPAGPLRETFEQATARASALVIIGDDKHKIAARTKLPVFTAHLNPCVPEGFPSTGRFVAFAGIGRPEKFYATARRMNLDLAATIDFPDHHVFTSADIDMLRLTAEEHGAHLLTTEKDAVRLPDEFRAETLVLPVQLAFDDPDAEALLMRLFKD
jgi:tetraacyldisaccharide 4'-kinase